jgi:glycerol-3-phosphate dehydrogenase (NAD(P)+)
LNSLAIIGAGSWGTALAIVLAPRFQDIRLWVYEADLAARMAKSRENDVYLPGFRLAPQVHVTPHLEESLENAEAVLSVVPSHVVRGIYRQMLPCLRPETVLVSATKGLETGTLLRVSEVISQVVSERFPPRITVLSGPTFAREVAAGDPTALVAASRDIALAETVQAAFSGPTFRLYTSSDPIGVEIGGSIKNVVAIGAGVLSGMGLGHNSTAALITRGLAEMSRLAVALGGQPKTMAGLAGLGDLVLTCNGELSRNRTVGLELARGGNLRQIIDSMNMVAEGIKTTDAAVGLARRLDVDMPICEQMFQVLHSGVPPQEAVRRLMDRTLRGE